MSETPQLKADWNYPTSIHFGTGRVAELADICRNNRIQKPLLVTDSSLARLEFVKNILTSICSAGINTEIFSEVKPNPTGMNITQGVNAYRDGNHDGVIAIGGGSALDAGKAIALMCRQNISLWQLEDSGNNWKLADASAIAPAIAIPTTAGTGSEVGRAAVILDETEKLKKIIFHPKMLPEQVIIDADLTTGLPAGITAATGMDAFVHNFEAFCSPAYHPMADGIALEAMRLIRAWLPIAVQQGDHIEARSHMLSASLMGATAFQKGLGAVHALAHPLGALYDAHHGLLNAILLPYVLQANKAALDTHASTIARYLQLEENSFNGLYKWVLSFRNCLGIPHRLSDINIDTDNGEEIGRRAAADPSAAGNPIIFDEHKYTEIFINAVHGKLP